MSVCAHAWKNTGNKITPVQCCHWAGRDDQSPSGNHSILGTTADRQDDQHRLHYHRSLLEVCVTEHHAANGNVTGKTLSTVLRADLLQRGRTLRTRRSWPIHPRLRQQRCWRKHELRATCGNSGCDWLCATDGRWRDGHDKQQNRHGIV